MQLPDEVPEGLWVKMCGEVLEGYLVRFRTVPVKIPAEGAVPEGLRL